MPRETLRNLALIVFSVCGVLWLAYRLPTYISNISIIVDWGLILSGTVIVVLWLVGRGEKNVPPRYERHETPPHRSPTRSKKAEEEPAFPDSPAPYLEVKRAKTLRKTEHLPDE